MQSNENDDSWSIAHIEEQCMEAIERQQQIEPQYLSERDNCIRSLFHNFQESATSIAQLYRDRMSSRETGALWIPFQTAAGTVTTLYKESCDGIRRTNDLAMNTGYHRRTREIADWARSKRRRYIRREDLLAYLAGKSSPPHGMIHVTRLSPQQHFYSNSQQSKPLHSHGSGSPTTAHQTQAHGEHHHHHGSATFVSSMDSDLHTFKEALARRSRAPELYAFVAGEIARNSKRPASPLDVNMDVQSLNSKRQRFM